MDNPLDPNKDPFFGATEMQPAKSLRVPVMQPYQQVKQQQDAPDPLDATQDTFFQSMPSWAEDIPPVPPGGIVDNPDNWISGKGAAVSSLARDPIDRIEQYAAQLFPDLPFPKAMQRMSMNNGRITYWSPEKGHQYAEPSLGGIRGGLTDTPHDIGTWLADNAAEISQFAGSAYAAAKTGVAKAATAVGLGDVLRQLAAYMVDPQDAFGPKSAEGFMHKYDPVSTGVEVGAELTGGLTSRLLGRWLQTTPRSDIEKFISDPQKRQSMLELKRKADEWGIRLTPAELSNLRSLRRRQNLLFDLAGSDDLMQAFNMARMTEQVPAAVRKFLTQIDRSFATNTGLDVGAERAVTGAKKTVDWWTARRTKQADPFFKRAYMSHAASGAIPNVLPVLRVLKDRSMDLADSGREAVNNALRLIASPVFQAGRGGMFDGKILERLDQVRQELWTMQEKAFNAGDKRAATFIRDAYFGLRDVMTDPREGGSQLYGRALKVFQDASPDIDVLAKSATGRVAKKADMGAEFYKPMQAARMLYEQGERGISRSRAQFAAANKLDQWNAGLRVYVQDAFERAARRGETSPANWALVNLRDEQFQRQMKAAMTDEQFEAMNSLLEVVAATGRAGPGGSRTMPSGELLPEMQAEARPWYRKVGGAVRNINPATALANLARVLEQGGDDRYFAVMAKVLTSRNGIERLRKLNGISPGTERGILISQQILWDAIKESGIEFLEPTDRQLKADIKAQAVQ